MSRFGESILHTVGRAVGSGAWQGIGARAVQAFQNAQRIKMAREQQGVDNTYRQAAFNDARAFRDNKFTADQTFREQVAGPALLQNADSKRISADASKQRADVAATALLDEMSGGKTYRGAFQKQVGNAPPSEVPALVGAYDPTAPKGGLTSPQAIEAFKAAEARASKIKIAEHAAKSSITQKHIGQRHAGERLLNAHVQVPKTASGQGMDPKEWDRRRNLTKEDQIVKAYITERIREGASREEIEAELEQFAKE